MYIAAGKCKKGRKENEIGVGESTAQRKAGNSTPGVIKQVRKEMKTKNYVRRAVIARRARVIARRVSRAVVARRARVDAG